MLTAVVLTRNEEQTIELCLKSLHFCDKIIVVDDFSTDATTKIAKKLGAQVLSHALAEDFSAQRNWALAQIKSSWVLFVDADEVVPPALATEIISAITKIQYKGFYLPRYDYMWQRPLKYGDLLGAKVLRLARHGAGEWVGCVHESWHIDGRVGTLENHLNHYPHANMVEFLQHLNYYSTLKANEFFAANRKGYLVEIMFAPLWRFFKTFFLNFGFLDGTAGFIHAMTMAFYVFLVAGKLYLLHKGIPK